MMFKVKALFVLIALILCCFGLQEETCPAMGCEVALLTIGNSGVGKSFWDNVIAGSEVFFHDYSAKSVTRETENVVRLIDNHVVSIFNMPGLVENNKANVQKNKKEIERAFDTSDHHVVLFVFGVGNGGRITGEDLATFQAIQRAYELKKSSVVFLINNISPQKFKDANYISEVKQSLIECLEWPANEEMRVVFAPNFPDEEKDTPKHIAGVLEIRSTLLREIFKSIPFTHKKKQNIEVTEDAIKSAMEKITGLENQNKEAKRAHEEAVRKLQEKIDAEQAASAARIARLEADVRNASKRRGCSGLFSCIGEALDSIF